MQDLSELIDRISDFPDDDVLILFAELTVRMRWDFKDCSEEKAESKPHIQHAIDDLLEIHAEDDILLALRLIAISRGLPFPRKPTLKAVQRPKIVNPVVVTTNGWFYHKESCECLYGVSNTGTRRLERDEAAATGRKPCNYCNPDG